MFRMMNIARCFTEEASVVIPSHRLDAAEQLQKLREDSLATATKISQFVENHPPLQGTEELWKQYDDCQKVLFDKYQEAINKIREKYNSIIETYAQHQQYAIATASATSLWEQNSNIYKEYHPAIQQDEAVLSALQEKIHHGSVN